MIDIQKLWVRPARWIQLACCTLLLSLASTPAQALVITITSPGNSVAGYVPLSSFGIAPIAGVGDDTITNFNVPNFLYAGETWSRIGIVSNGYLIVGGGDSSDIVFEPQDVPKLAHPNNVLAPFWTDLNPAGGGSVSIATITNGADTWIVVDWNQVKNFGNGNTNSFETWIGLNSDAHPGEDITFVYGVIGTGDPDSGLGVLAEDKTGTVGFQYYRLGVGTLPLSNTDLRVSTSGSPVPAPVPEPSALVLTLSCLIPVALRRARRQLAQ